MVSLSRRDIITALSGGVVCACSTETSRSMARSLKGVEDLVVINRIAPASIGLAMPGYRLDGTEAGHMGQPELTPVMAVSLDANRLAWLSSSSLDHYKFTRVTEPNPTSRVLYADGLGPIQEIEFSGGYPVSLAVSSNGTRMAAVVRKNRTAWQLLIVDPNTGEQEFDFTERFTEQESGYVELSGAGDLFVLMGRDAFAIIDLAHPSEITRVNGGFGSISPDGKTVAFVNRSRRLLLYSVSSGKSRPLLVGKTVVGCGAWSPDGRLLLVGAMGILEKQLGIVDIESGAYQKIFDIDEGALGATYCWINKRFLTV